MNSISHPRSSVFLQTVGLRVVLAVALLSFTSLSARAQTKAPKRIDVEVVQGVLAVRSLDGWLLAEANGKNPVAQALVAPEGTTKRLWFYFIPSSGQPMILVHKSEASVFDGVPGTKIEYSGFRDLKAGIRTILGGARNIAMEYAPKSGIPSLTRVDSATVALVKRVGVQVSSSADLVQLTKSLWGPEGRAAHYLAVHHLTKLRDEAFAFIAKRISNHQAISELDVQKFLAEGYRVRGLQGTISVAAGESTSKPNYIARKRRSRAIKKGQVILLRLSAAVPTSVRPIFASMSWVAYVGETVPARVQKLFAVVSGARDTTISFLRSRAKKRRLVRGMEADQRARQAIGKAGLASRFVHRTGHSLDNNLNGDGANLDDYETHDTRNLVIGSGFTVGPGVYVPGDYGIQSIASVHMVQGGIEVTTPLQTRVTPLLLH